MYYYSIPIFIWAINSAVECLPYKQKVTGSNPVSPTYFCIFRVKLFVKSLFGENIKIARFVRFNLGE